MHAYPPRVVAIAKASEDHAWRGRTLTVCSLLLAVVMAVAAVQVDWSNGVAMALGQLAGVLAPLVVLGLGVWGVAALVGRKA